MKDELEKHDGKEIKGDFEEKMNNKVKRIKILGNCRVYVKKSF
jgi:hypothetical protein